MNNLIKCYCFFTLCGYLVGCSPKEDIKTKVSIEEKIAAILEEVGPAIEYDFSKVDQPIPECRILRQNLETSYDVSEHITFEYDEQDRLVKKEFYGDEKLRRSHTFEYESQNLVKEYLRENHDVSYIFSDGLLKEVDLLTDGEINERTIWYYSNQLPNRMVTANFMEEVTVFDLVSDQYGNIIKAELIFQNGEPPTKSFRTEWKFDTNFNPFFGLIGFEDSNYFFAPNNRIEEKVYIDDVLREDNENVSYHFDVNKFLSVKEEDFGSIHNFEYVYECD